MPFLTKLQTEHVKGNDWKVINSLVYVTEKSKKRIEVPVGFVTDYASIPKLLLGVFGRPSGKMAEPATLHDYLYRTKTDFSRKEADEVFFEALRGKGVSWFKAYTLYAGVRVAGSSSFR